MYWRLMGMLRPYRVPIFIGFVCLMVATPAQLFHPLVWMYIVDEVIGERRVHMLVPALLVMLVVHLFGAGLGAYRSLLLGRAGQRFVADLRERLHGKLIHQSVAYHHDRQSGELVSRVMGDVDALQEVVINGADNIVANLLGLIWVAGIIIWLQPVVGTVTLVPLAFVAVITWYFNKRVRKLYRRVRDRLGDLSSHLQEQLQGVVVVKAFAREARERELFRQRNASYLNESLKGVTARSLYFPSVMAIGFLTNIAMIGVGAWFVLRGQFTIGGLVAYRGYWWQLFSPVFTLAQANEMVQRAIASASRVFEVLDAPEIVIDRSGAQAVPETDGHIEFHEVTFGYRPGSPILRDISFSVSPGERVGLVGPSGAGKSTILSLILRLYEHQAGLILLDGCDILNLQQRSMRQHMGLVAQEPFLFNDTVGENIRFGRLDATEDEIEEAASLANAHEFIEQLPDRYGTLVGERGVKLSGGQKQRIAIARAFLANPRILLLDEATAAVEPESESLIIGALERLERGRTTIIVSHRLPLVRDCDTILVINNGHIAERGTHDELMDADGWYARMYNLQVKGVPL